MKRTSETIVKLLKERETLRQKQLMLNAKISRIRFLCGHNVLKMYGRDSEFIYLECVECKLKYRYVPESLENEYVYGKETTQLQKHLMIYSD